MDWGMDTWIGGLLRYDITSPNCNRYPFHRRSEKQVVRFSHWQGITGRTIGHGYGRFSYVVYDRKSRNKQTGKPSECTLENGSRHHRPMQKHKPLGEVTW